MQLEIYSPTQAQPLPPVEWNYDELKQWVSDGLEAYRGRVYTEDTVTEAKRDRATLNKLAQAIEDRRREIKAVYLAPYDQFEKQAKELVEMVKTQSREIDAQIKTYDRQRREEKLERIKTELYAPMIGDLAEAIPYEKLHDPKWLNVTFSMAAVSEALATKIESIRSGFAALHKLDVPPDVLHQIHAEFAKDFDLAAAIAAKDRILEEKKHMLEFARHLEAQNATRATQDDGSMEQRPTSEKPAEVRETANDDEPVMQLDFRAWVTRSQMLALREFLVNNGIKFGKVPKESEE
jgi:hypothetical protein